MVRNGRNGRAEGKVLVSHLKKSKAKKKREKKQETKIDGDNLLVT